MTTNTLTSSFTAAPCHRIYSSRLAFSCRLGPNTAKFCSRRCCRGRIPLFPRRVLRFFCQTKKPIRRYSPFFEATLLSSGGRLGSDDWQAVPDIWRSSAEKYGDRIALVDPYRKPPSNITYNQISASVINDDVKMLKSLSAFDPELFNRIAEVFCDKASIRFLILPWGDKASLSIKGTEDMPIFSYNEMINLGQDRRKSLLDSKDTWNQGNYGLINSDNVATLIYTSGTTGNPKGVMLTHSNLLHRIRNLWDIVPAVPGDRFLSLLPPWHIYERSCESSISHMELSKCTRLKNLKEDLRQYQPHYLISVPLVYETLYREILKQLSTGSTARKLTALTFVRISMAFMDFKGVYEGKYLTRDPKQPAFLVSMLDCLWARFAAAILWPMHMLAETIVYSKIRSTFGISKAGVSGGSQLPMFVDKFFEAGRSFGSDV